MKQAARIVLLVMLFAALPLRGYAGMMMTLCEAGHGGVAAAAEQAHEHGESHHHDDSDGGSTGPAQAASSCSVCASCCLGAGLALQAELSVTFPSPGAPRIAFLGRQNSGFVPDHLDRPPLAS